jgi:predicted  nucleic acid-binding Zn-ribbon protein
MMRSGMQSDTQALQEQVDQASQRLAAKKTKGKQLKALNAELTTQKEAVLTEKSREIEALTA